MSEPEDTELDGDLTKREGHGAQRAKASAERLERGTAVGRYIIIDLLGEGGMGVVYTAYDPELDRKVAIKLLQAKPASGSTGDQAWLLREAQAMARLSHPNVLAVHDVGSLPGDRVFVAMELVDGVTLRKWLRERERSWNEVLPIMLAAGAGLAAAHAGGLVHRDFKPDNVLVGRDHRVRVMDFGLARLRQSDDTVTPHPTRPSDAQIDTASPLSASMTLAGTVVGTPAYMAPELREGYGADSRSDQFSFGVALYEALYRTRPFVKDSPKGTKAKPPPADSHVPARIQKIVLRAVSLQPDERYGSMEELLAALAVDVATTRRRVVVGAAATIGLGIAVVAGFALSGSPESQLCTGIDRRLTGVWDAPTKLTIQRAFEATKKPYAPKAFAGLSRALDGYTHDWSATAAESCEATRVRGEQTEEVLSLREACLDQRLDELRALTQLLATADAALVEKGDKVVSGLEPVSRCTNVAALRAPGQPPTEPKAKLDQLHKLLAESKAGLAAGRYLPSVAAAKQAAKLADEVHYAPYNAEALLVECASLNGAGNPTDAAVACTEAAWLALQGRRDDIVAGAALAAAITVSGNKIGEARIWLGLARSVMTRIGHDPALELRTLEVEGLVAALGGDMEGAIAAQTKARDAAERMFGPDSPLLWADEEVVAVTLAKAGAWDKAQPHLERALALHEQSVGPDHPDIALILVNLGACYSHAGQAAKAKAAYERSLAIRERTEGSQNPMFVLTLNNMADGLIKSGDTTGALFYLDRAKQLGEKLLGKANPLYHAVATTRAEALAAAGRLDESRAQYDEVLALETKLNSPLLGPSLGSRATMEINAKQWKDAAAFEQRAITAFEAVGGKEAPDLWPALSGLAQAQIALGRAADARPLLERAIAIGEKAQANATDLAPTRAMLKKLGP